MRFTAIYPASKNFTPSELMQDHAKLNPRATFHRDRYSSSYLLIDGTRYYYDRWKIENGSNDDYMCVTVYLKER